MKAQTTDTASIESLVRHGFQGAALSLFLLLAGCGGGSGGSAPAAVNVAASPPTQQAAANIFTVTNDNYGMQSASYLACGKSSLGIVLRAAIASSMTDPNFQTVSRIDISPNAAIGTGSDYSLGGATAGNPFPGDVLILNGHPSTLLKTVGGTIHFTAYGSNSGDRISGSYSAIVEDDNDPAKPTYTIAAQFDLVTDSDGPVLPAPPASSLAATSYAANCATCHSLGNYDTTASGGAPDLALRGGQMNGIFTPGQASHQGLQLAAGEITALKVLLNSN